MAAPLRRKGSHLGKRPELRAAALLPTRVAAGGPGRGLLWDFCCIFYFILFVPVAKPCTSQAWRFSSC